MKKIMFNDRFGLTQAVLEGRKTQTRRIADQSLYYLLNLDAMTYKTQIVNSSRYKVGEVVAIAQAYKDIFEEDSAQGILEHPTVLLERKAWDTAGWKNKMFVKADSMKHHIGITNVRVERLQDISEEDCIAEGIEFYGSYYGYRIPNFTEIGWRTAQIAYSVLIDNVGKRGTWESNPYVFVYEFELID